MIYILANNKSYTTEHLEKLPVKEDDTIIVCNMHWNNKLPDWKNVHYIWFVRNIRDFVRDGWDLSIIDYIKPEKVFYVFDPNGNDLQWQQDLNIPFEEVPAKYPDGMIGAPSTGFVAAMTIPEAVCVGFETMEMYDAKAWHDFPYEHEIIEKTRQNIFL